VTLATLGWEIMNHPPYSTDLAPGDFHLFGPRKVHLGGQKFQTDELNCNILNWLHGQDKTFYAAGMGNLPGQWIKCVSVKGEYLDPGMYILSVKNKVHVSLEPPS
jgi:histone-lysine N-methyltransferase SETMAR